MPDATPKSFPWRFYVGMVEYGSVGPLPSGEQLYRSGDTVFTEPTDCAVMAQVADIDAYVTSYAALVKGGLLQPLETSAKAKGPTERRFWVPPVPDERWEDLSRSPGWSERLRHDLGGVYTVRVFAKDTGERRLLVVEYQTVR